MSSWIGKGHLWSDFSGNPRYRRKNTRPFYERHGGIKMHHQNIKTAVGSFVIPLRVETASNSERRSQAVEVKPMNTGLNKDELKIIDLMGIDVHQYIEANSSNLSSPTPAVVNRCDSPAQLGLCREEIKIIDMMGLTTTEYIAANSSRATSYAPISVNSQLAGVSMGLNSEESRVCELTGISPADYLRTKRQEHGTDRNQQGESLEELEFKIAELMGIPLGDIQRRKDQIAKRAAAMDAASQKLSDDEINICWALGIDPEKYKKMKSEAILNQL